MKFEDKLTKEFLKIVHYNLQTSISLFSKDIKVEQSFSSSESLFHKLAASGTAGSTEHKWALSVYCLILGNFKFVLLDYTEWKPSPT